MLVAPRFEACCGRGLWRFTSCHSTLETVCVSWLAWPCKWQCRLTDVEWDVIEPLKMINSLALTTFSVPILEYIWIYTPCACRALWHGGCGLRLWIKKSRVLVLAVAAWQCVLGQSSSPVCALFQPRVNWYLAGWWLLSLYVWIVSSATVAAGLYAPQGVALVLKWTGPISRGTIVRATIIQLLAASRLSAPPANMNILKRWSVVTSAESRVVIVL